MDGPLLRLIAIGHFVHKFAAFGTLIVEMASINEDFPVDWSPRTTIRGSLIVSLIPNSCNFWLHEMSACASLPRMGARVPMLAVKVPFPALSGGSTS